MHTRGMSVLHSHNRRARRSVIVGMAETITLRVFWTFMLLCACTALTTIWVPDLLPERLIPTFFIIGFASFLIWAPLTVYRFLNKLG